MASAGSQPSAAAKPLFCYMCERTVSITVNPTTVPSCPLCQEGFLEECDASNSPNPNANLDPFGSFQDPNLLFSSASIDVPQNPSSEFATRGAAPALPDPNGYNPMDFLRNHFQTLRSGGPRIQFVVVDNNPSEGGFMLRGGSNPSSVLASRGAVPALPDPNGYNPMDFLRNHFQTLHSGGPRIQFVVIDNNPSEGGLMLRGGSNPSSVLASRGAAPALPDPNGYNPMDFLRNHFQTLHSGGPRIQFAEQRPVCRYELPTDDPDYERERRGEDAGPGEREQEQLGGDGGQSST